MPLSELQLGGAELRRPSLALEVGLGRRDLVPQPATSEGQLSHLLLVRHSPVHESRLFESDTAHRILRRLPL